MIYFLNSNGTTTLVKSEPVYQGSINASKLVVFAPFATSSKISPTFTLPNGLDKQGKVMSLLVGSQGLFDKQGNRYNAWSIDLDAPVTQYPGTVRVQFSISLGNGVNLNSYSTQFIVEKGVLSDLPDYSINSNALDVFNDIKDYLATIEQNTQEAIDNGIAYVRYESTGNRINTSGSVSVYVVDGTRTVISTNEDVPNITNGDVTVASMTKYLTDEQIINPNVYPNNDENFFQYNVGSSSPQSPAGFIIDLGESRDIGYIQLYLYSIQWDIGIEIRASNSLLGNYVPLREISISPITSAAGIDYNSMLIFKANAYGGKYRYVKVVQTTGATNGSYVCKGVEIFHPNNTGYYHIKQNNGNYFNLDTINATELLDTIKDFTTQAQNYSIEAQKWANGEGATDSDPQFENNAKYWSNIVQEYNKLANKVGGFPVMIAGNNGQPVIPSVFINQVDIKEYVEITEENELETIDVQIGDIALLVEMIDNVKTVTKSWILLNIDTESGSRDWAVYGTSYATNSGNAEFAKEAENSLRINGNALNVVSSATYESLTDKTGIYFVIRE